MRPISPEDANRIKVQADTTRIASDPKWEVLAEENLARWEVERNGRHPRPILLITMEDTLNAAEKYTKIFGTKFAILNMANAHYPGGGYKNGRAAQEENIYRRTNASILDRYPKYTQMESDQINGKDPKKGYPLRTLICIKGPEIAGTGTGYDLLDDNDVFAVEEMRSAAVNQNSKATLPLSRDDLREEMSFRIALQFKTLILAGYRHVILGAFGCGAFGNDPIMISNIYRKYLERYRDNFDVVVFGIHYAGYGQDNYSIFAETLRYVGLPWTVIIGSDESIV